MGNCVPKKVPNVVVGNPIHDDEVPSIDHTNGQRQTHSTKSFADLPDTIFCNIFVLV